jgi:hypothetical protein
LFIKRFGIVNGNDEISIDDDTKAAACCGVERIGLG